MRAHFLALLTVVAALAGCVEEVPEEPAAVDSVEPLPWMATGVSRMSGNGSACEASSCFHATTNYDPAEFEVVEPVSGATLVAEWATNDDQPAHLWVDVRTEAGTSIAAADGSHQLELTLGDLQPGTYQVRLRPGNDSGVYVSWSVAVDWIVEGTTQPDSAVSTT